MSRTLTAVALLLAFCVPLALAADDKKDKRGLDIHWIDTEGGAATLIVTPAGESVLIDCGNPGSRDAERIAAAATKIGLKAIDHLIITHWHSDHYGGADRLSKLLPIRHFHDRGIPESLKDDPRGFPVLIGAYKKASSGKSSTLKAGDEVKLKQADGAPAVRLLCVCSSGEVIAEAKDAKENSIAKDHKAKSIAPSDNDRSLGFVLSFGAWRFLDLGDLTWNEEARLVSPSNRIGEVDVFQVTHHGQESSNNPVLIRSVNPRVTVCNNGPKKGGAPSVVSTLRRLPQIEAIYQLHRNLSAKDGETADVDKIANDSRNKESGKGIALAVAADAKSYTVTVRDKTFTHKTRGER